ncbi:hypothetical protein DACRYDRAFT_24356 [Dacryopinax primogenitus]|uniref:Uncharacterized protein n=1 Tax=Dacryopinax primogenitus (strain DJM 731) TaxID=1858805 RepID=M5FPV7_DACPD|nr:uncharacterized protein DACRYDRAFT_24356 [Dacryopinax primogenitus]EJT98810.1 hypothetical protein DACRYDRAFT_24356 [Dacryopinax primogenitus]
MFDCDLKSAAKVFADWCCIGHRGDVPSVIPVLVREENVVDAGWLYPPIGKPHVLPHPRTIKPPKLLHCMPVPSHSKVKQKPLARGTMDVVEAK